MNTPRISASPRIRLHPWAAQDLCAFVESSPPRQDVWLNNEVDIGRHRWLKNRRGEPYPNLIRVCGTERLAALPERTSRSAIFELDVAADPLGFFLNVMAWGHNNNNTGAKRTDGILAHSGAPAAIEKMIGEVREDRLKQAFNEIHRRDDGPLVLAGLGTSFGSKLLYFAGYSRDNPSAPLIFDDLVATGLARTIHSGAASSTWRSGTKQFGHYQTYLDTVADLRDLYVAGARTDAVEIWLWWMGGSGAWHLPAMRRTQRWLGTP